MDGMNLSGRWPNRVEHEQVTEFLKLVGVPVDRTVSVQILPGKIEVIAARLDAGGKPYVVGNEFATESWQVGW